MNSSTIAHPATARTPGLMPALLSILAVGLAFGCARKGTDPPRVPDAREDLVTPASEASGTRSVVLAGGCFWCTEAVFEELDGVVDVVSGYAGGTAESADYKEVSAGRTDHAEVIRITFDPARITYGKLLEVFFSVAHDPTQKDRQGPDHGRQYRSAVFYADEDERRTAEAYILQLDESGAFDAPIATTLEPLEGFWPAEDYHQDFVRGNPSQPYVVRYALPKVKKVRERYAELIEPSGGGG